MRSDGSAARRLTSDGFADADARGLTRRLADRLRLRSRRSRRPRPVDGLRRRLRSTAAADRRRRRPLDRSSPPTASYVVLSTNASGNFDVAYVSVAGAPHATATSITFRSSLDETTPSIQPDMVRLAYTQAAIPGPSDILTAYSDDGTDEFPLAVDPAQHERSPAFSPDGTEVVYVTDAGLVCRRRRRQLPRPARDRPGFRARGPGLGRRAGDRQRSPPRPRSPSRRSERPTRTTARFRFRSSEPGSSCSVQARQPRLRGRVESSKKYRHLTAKRHVFRVRAIRRQRQPRPLAGEGALRGGRAPLARRRFSEA